MAKSDNLRKAKENKNDEFYTQLSDIIAEIAQHKDYVRQFEGKTVFCNCDDPEWSSFVEFFVKFFNKLKLKKIISTHYNKDGSPSYKLEWSGEKIHGDTVNMIKTPLQGNGDFRSEECIELVKEADIVVTNPPFSLFREYVAQLMEYGKQFVILGNTNAVAYKEFFPLLRDNKVFVGYKSPSGGMWFTVTDEFRDKVLSGEAKATYRMEKNSAGKEVMYCNCPAMWYTNLDLDKSHEPLILTKNYMGNEDRYPDIVNYKDAVFCKTVKDIPKDVFDKPLVVPITYIASHCPSQFDILALSVIDAPPIKNYVNENAIYTKGGPAFYTDMGNNRYHREYARVVIKRKPTSQED